MEELDNKREKSIRLSIVVPIYNVEKYLERCLNSLINQDIPKDEYEIIIVNDGSTDNSYKIAKHFADEYCNIQLCSQENQGLSVARNTGMEAANGKYILFVDSDDYLKENVLKSIVFTAESEDLDICIFKFTFKQADGTFHDCGKIPYNTNKMFSGEELLLQGYQVASVWKNLYKSDLIRRYSMSFYPGILHQDVEFNNRIFPLANRVKFVDTICYFYCIHADSSSRGTTPAKVMYIIKSDIDVAAQLKQASRSSVYSRPIQNLFAKKSHSITVSFLLGLIRAKRIDHEAKIECLAFAKKRGIYPCCGRTLSWKTTLLLLVLGNEFLYKRFL